MRKILAIIIPIIFLVPSFLMAQGDGFSASHIVTFAEPPQAIELTNCMTIYAGKFFTFPKMLEPMGDYNWVGYQIEVDDGDTIFYQFIAGSTPWDTNTVLNFGSVVKPQRMFFVVYDSTAGMFDNAGEFDAVQYFPAGWEATDVFLNQAGYNLVLTAQAGYESRAPYAGIKIGAGQGSDIACMRLTMYKGRIGYAKAK